MSENGSVSTRRAGAAVSICFAGLAAGMGPAPAVAQSGLSADTTAYYEVECADAQPADGPRCEVDLATFIGWRVYHAQCARCHAPDGLGSDFAPELAPRIQHMAWTSFADMLDRGYAGLEGLMPAWGDDPDVARYERELWTYLNARAGGALPPGPVGRLPEG